MQILLGTVAVRARRPRIANARASDQDAKRGRISSLPIVVRDEPNLRVEGQGMNAADPSAVCSCSKMYLALELGDG
jgi:hypothetical protein